jgi:hypothetical protein
MNRLRIFLSLLLEKIPVTDIEKMMEETNHPLPVHKFKNSALKSYVDDLYVRLTDVGEPRV